jgi:hypothetical protein
MSFIHEADHSHHLDLRGLSNNMIEMHILRLFNGQAGRLHLDCLFDEDPNDALRDLERHCSQWNFQRVENAHWIICNYAQAWDAGLSHRLGLPPGHPPSSLERREHLR